MNENYAIELDEMTYGLSKNVLETQNNFQTMTGCKFLISDFEMSVSRVMHVEADVKYAEAMVVRRLQNEGEFDEPVSIITHWKKKHGKNNTEIFFTALPSRIYLQYIDKIIAHNDLIILFPIFSILANAVKRLANGDPIAVVFRHDRFADLVIGKNNHFYFATRCVAFDTTPEQIQTLWDTISKEISFVNQENSIQVKDLICLNWIDAQETVPEMELSGINIVKATKETIIHEQATCHISFPMVLKMFAPMDGIAPQNGKLFYYSDKLGPFIITAFLIAIVILSCGTLFFQSKTKEIKQNLSPMENRIELLKDRIHALPQDTNYRETLAFVDSIFHNQHLPSYSDIVNDISKGMFNSTIVELLKINYEDRQVKIIFTGIINSNFDVAYKGYQFLLSSLQQDGYIIENNLFNTKIDSSRFELELSWGVK